MRGSNTLPRVGRVACGRYRATALIKTQPNNPHRNPGGSTRLGHEAVVARIPVCSSEGDVAQGIFSDLSSQTGTYILGESYFSALPIEGMETFLEAVKHRRNHPQTSVIMEP